MSSDLKVSEQCRKVVKTANRVIGMIYRTITGRSSDILLPLYKSRFRPRVEAWRPYLRKDIDNVQRRAKRIMDDVRGDD